MRKQGFGIGGGTLLLLFSVLILIIFALLTLSTARREATLTEKRQVAVEDYYRADSRAADLATALLSRWREGDVPATLEDIIITDEGGEIYAYLCPIDNRRAISVRLRLSEEGMTILSWKTAEIAPWTPDESLDVWGGEEDPWNP